APAPTQNRIAPTLGAEPAAHDHRVAGEKGRPVARAAPQHQPVPARRALIRKQHLAHARMDRVASNKDIALRGLDMRAGAVEEMRDHAAFVLGEGAEPAAGMDDVFAEAIFDGAMDDALQATAMDRELRHVVTGAEAARLAPDFLAMAVEIVQIIGANRDRIELVQ